MNGFLIYKILLKYQYYSIYSSDSSEYKTTDIVKSAYKTVYLGDKM